jgi:hypothetical protein
MYFFPTKEDIFFPNKSNNNNNNNNNKACNHLRLKRVMEEEFPFVGL